MFQGLCKIPKLEVKKKKAKPSLRLWFRGSLSKISIYPKWQLEGGRSGKEGRIYSDGKRLVGEHTVSYTDDVLQNCTLETCKFY